MNASHLPSGLKRGCDSLSGLAVSRTCSVPAQLVIQRSESSLSRFASANVTA